MAEAILDLRLDTVQPNRVRLVYGVQNDYNSRYICARFTVNGKPIDIEKTAAVRINAKRPDGNKDAFPGTVNTDGTAKVPVAQWMLEVPGEVSASITAVTTGGALTTQEFYIMAKASIWDSTGEPSAENPDKDVLQTIIASENERVAAESTRVANENARKSAETARATAETKRIANEAERQRNAAEYKAQVDLVREEISTWQDEWGKISSFDKRIENLEAAVSPGMVMPTIDDTIAYRKTVPNGVLPNAAVCEVGGMSYKCENLAKPSISHQWLSTASIADDGKITITCNAVGTAFCIAYRCAVKAGETYYVKLHNVSGISKVVFFADAHASTGSLLGVSREGAYTARSDATIYIGIYLHDSVASGTVGSCYVMINKGSTALPYQPYFEGLRDSKVTAVESVGANCIPFPYSFSAGTYNGVNLTINSDGTFALNGTATGASYLLLQTATLPAGTYYVSDSGENDWKSRFYVSHSENYFKNSSFTLTEPTLVEFRIAIYESFSGTATLKPMVNRGTEALPYSPYFRESLPIPADALDGWGQGVNAQYCNKIVLDPLEGVKKYVKNVNKVVFDGSSDENWGFAVGRSYAHIVVPRGANIAPFPDNYRGVGITWLVWDYRDTIQFGSSTAPLPTFSTEAEFRAWLAESPLEIVYGLNTSTETDVSHLFTDDNLLSVETGGTITAVNEYEQAVPTSIEYTVKGA